MRGVPYLAIDDLAPHRLRFRLDRPFYLFTQIKCSNGFLSEYFQFRLHVRCQAGTGSSTISYARQLGPFPDTSVPPNLASGAPEKRDGDVGPYSQPLSTATVASSFTGDCALTGHGTDVCGSVFQVRDRGSLHHPHQADCAT